MQTDPAKVAASLTEARAFTADDIPDWLEIKLSPAEVDRYVQQRNEIIEQARREAKLAGGWRQLAMGYLRTIGDNAPPFGGLHHTLLIIVDHLGAELATTSRSPTHD